MKTLYIFLATVLFLFSTSCQQKEEFSAERARELASLHKSASDYTESEIRDIEMQVDMYFSSCESMLDEILTEQDFTERQRKTIKFLSWYQINKNTTDTVGDLMLILNNNPHLDKKKVDSFNRRLVEICYNLRLIQDKI